MLSSILKPKTPGNLTSCEFTQTEDLKTGEKLNKR